MVFIFVLFVALLVLSPSASAERVYRCIQQDGQISFQYHQCENMGQQINAEPAVNSGWTTLSDGEQALLKEYYARDEQRKRALRKTPAKKKLDKVSEACWKKQKSLETVETKLRRGYSASQGEVLRRKRDHYTEYLRKFCS